MMSEPTPEISRNVSPSEGISAMELRMMPRDEVIALYHRLEAPPFEEMHGEFAATLLDQGSARGYLLSAFAVHMKGRWLGKAFEPTGPNQGHGYNYYMTPRGVRRATRMKTRLGPSKLPGDTNDAFHLEYADLNDFKRGGLGGAMVHTMFDEVRKVSKDLYVGIGRTGFTEKARAALHPFILEGPVAPFVPTR